MFAHVCRCVVVVVCPLIVVSLLLLLLLFLAASEAAHDHIIFIYLGVANKMIELPSLSSQSVPIITKCLPPSLTLCVCRLHTFSERAIASLSMGTSLRDVPRMFATYHVDSICSPLHDQHIRLVTSIHVASRLMPVSLCVSNSRSV